MKHKSKFKFILLISIILLGIGFILLPIIADNSIFITHKKLALTSFSHSPLSSASVDFSPPEIAEIEKTEGVNNTSFLAWAVKIESALMTPKELSMLLVALQQKKFDAFLQKQQDNEHEEILVGPTLTEAEALKISKELKEFFNLKTQVIKYENIQ